MEFVTDSMPSPIGEITVVSDGTALRALDFEGYEARMKKLLERQYGVVTLRRAKDPGGVITALKRYLEGELDVIDDIPVQSNGTPFQQTVWMHLRDIPAGHTESYGALAARVGRPKASRAVGLANGTNPIPIVVPCHRVIGANGKLTGYGGGMERKQWLLAHEGALLL